MAFMQRQVTSKQPWLKVETVNGTDFLPSDLVPNVANCPEAEVEDNSIWLAAIRPYVESEPISWEWITGYGARLSAPGYLDCTEWTVFDTAEEAEQYLDENYPEDEDGEEADNE